MHGFGMRRYNIDSMMFVSDTSASIVCLLVSFGLVWRNVKTISNDHGNEKEQEVDALVNFYKHKWSGFLLNVE